MDFFHLDQTLPLLDTMIGGKSVLDTPKLHIYTKESAYAFIKSYGFDLHKDEDEKKLWGYHRRSLVFLKEKLLEPHESIPEKLAQPNLLEDLKNLLIYASLNDNEEPNLSHWSCAILRVMHIFIHSEKDLYSYFAPEIQKQILAPFQECVTHESHGIYLKHPFSKNEIKINNFEIKPFKTASSSALKLLSKPDVIALKVLDKIGVRFITESLFDSFNVALFLAENNLINYAQVIPDQSSNTLYPLNLLVDIIRSTTQNISTLEEKKNFDTKKMDLLLKLRLSSYEQESKDIKYLRKENTFSHSNYRFLKFICRKLIHLKKNDQDEFHFFYPYEIQIVDKESHEKNEMGQASHSEYKARQKEAARRRVFSRINLKQRNNQLL